MTKPINQPVDITIAGSDLDPRTPALEVAGVRIHRVPALHPDDVTVVDGIPITSVARTLVDLAETLPRHELRAVFARARELGMLDLAAVEASYARLEWRPSLPMLREVIQEFSR